MLFRSGLFECLGLAWDDFSAIDELDDQGRFPHEAVLRISQAVESNPVPHDVGAREFLVKRRQKLLIMLRLYSEWYEEPESIPARIRGFLAGRAPGMEARAAHLRDRRPWLALAFS